MTVRLTPSQVDHLHKIRRGVNRCPPLRYDIVQALVRKGFVAEHIVNGSVFYLETEKGKDFP